MICGPRAMISPGSPIGISFVPVSTSTMRMSVPTSGMPTEPVFGRVGGLKVSPGEDSVMPYPSHSFFSPMMASSLRMASTGKGAAPDTATRRREKSISRNRGESVSIMYSVGTLTSTVGGYCFIMAQNMSTLRGSGTTRNLAAFCIATSTNDRPAMWKNGKATPITSMPGSAGLNASPWRALENMFFSVSSAPLGLPVVPPVYWM